MVKTTRKQRIAIHRKWKQWIHPEGDPVWPSYKAFRKTVRPTIGCDNAVTVPWCGMWLCIETDGYTHS